MEHERCDARPVLRIRPVLASQFLRVADVSRTAVVGGEHKRNARHRIADVAPLPLKAEDEARCRCHVVVRVENLGFRKSNALCRGRHQLHQSLCSSPRNCRGVKGRFLIALSSNEFPVPSRLCRRFLEERVVGRNDAFLLRDEGRARGAAHGVATCHAFFFVFCHFLQQSAAVPFIQCFSKSLFICRNHPGSVASGIFGACCSESVAFGKGLGKLQRNQIGVAVEHVVHQRERVRCHLHSDAHAERCSETLCQGKLHAELLSLIVIVGVRTAECRHDEFARSHNPTDGGGVRRVGREGSRAGGLFRIAFRLLASGEQTEQGEGEKKCLTHGAKASCCGGQGSEFRFLQAFRVFCHDEVGDAVLDVAVHEGLKIVDGVVDSVVRDSSLRVVVGANFGGAVTG